MRLVFISGVGSVKQRQSVTPPGWDTNQSLVSPWEKVVLIATATRLELVK